MSLTISTTSYMVAVQSATLSILSRAVDLFIIPNISRHEWQALFFVLMLERFARHKGLDTLPYVAFLIYSK